jgi:hypothetical protein
MITPVSLFCIFLVADFLSSHFRGFSHIAPQKQLRVILLLNSNLQVFLCPEEEGGTGASSGETDSEQELSPIKTRVMLRLDKSSMHAVVHKRDSSTCFFTESVQPTCKSTVILVVFRT